MRTPHKYLGVLIASLAMLILYFPVIIKNSKYFYEQLWVHKEAIIKAELYI